MGVGRGSSPTCALSSSSITPLANSCTFPATPVSRATPVTSACVSCLSLAKGFEVHSWKVESVAYWSSRALQTWWAPKFSPPHFCSSSHCLIGSCTELSRPYFKFSMVKTVQKLSAFQARVLGTDETTGQQECPQAFVSYAYRSFLLHRKVLHRWAHIRGSHSTRHCSSHKEKELLSAMDLTSPCVSSATSITVWNTQAQHPEIAFCFLSS